MKRRNLLLINLKLLVSVVLFWGLIGTNLVNGQTLMHSYTFEDGTANDGTGTVNGVLEGTASVVDGELVLDAEGDYVSFDGTALDLNSYSASGGITFEFMYVSTVGSNDGHWNWLSYFGGESGAGSIMAGVNTWGQFRLYKNNTDPKIEVASADDGGYHHVVVVMTDAKIAMYADGDLIGEQATTDGFAIDASYSYLGRAFWADPTWIGNVDEFNIYSGEMNQATVTERFIAYVGPAYTDPTLAGISTDVGTLNPVFESQTVEYDLTVPYGTTQIDFNLTPTVSGASIVMFDSNANEYGAGGIVAFSGDGIDLEISVTALDGSTSATYYVYIYVDAGVSDATLSSIDLSVSAIDPVFDPSVTTYTAIVPIGTTSVDVTGVPNFPEASVSGNGTVALTNGAGSVDLQVTSQDNSASETYTVNFVEADGTNYALSLPGVDGNLSNVNISGLDLTSLPFTLEMWIKPNGSQTANCGLFFQRPNNIGLEYASGWQGADILRFLTAPDEGDLYGSNSLTSTVLTDKWHHVAVVMTDKTRTVYLDGVAKTEVASFTSTSADYATGNLYLGWDSDVAGRAFNGLIDEVRVWNDSLDATVLDANQYEVLNGDETGLIAYYNFDINNSSQAIDITVGGNNGVITGGTYVESFPRVNLELNSISLSEGKLYPEFSSKTTNYHTVLPAGTTSITVSAVANDLTTILSGTGAIDITSNNGTIVITASSQDGKYSQDYTITYVLDTPLTLMHSYSFADGTAKDVVGTADGTIMGGSVVDGVYIADENGEYIELPAADIAINTYPSITLELYVTDEINTINPNTNHMIAYFGDTNADNNYGVDHLYVSMKCRTAISCLNYGSPWASETGVSTESDLSDDGFSHHIVSTLTSDSICLYVDGFLINSAYPAADNFIPNISDAAAYIMKSGYAPDNTFLGSVLEYNIYSGEMSAQEVAIRSLDFPQETAASDATLSDLTADGLTITDFDPATLTYTVTLPEGSTAPVIGATAKNASANVVITDATVFPGTATVEVTSEDTQNTNTYTIEFTVLTGIGSVNDVAIEVYPSVSTGDFTVSVDGTESIITVYDLSGSVVKEIKTSDSKTTLSVPYPNMYIVKVTSDGVSKVFKVIKK